MKKYVSFLLIFLGISSNFALAATGSIEFAGSASAFCSFSNINNGALVIDTSNPTKISTTASGGTPATFNISYLGTPTVSIEEVASFIIKPNGVNSSDFVYSTTVASGSSATYQSSGGFLTSTYSSGTADQLSVNLVATRANSSSVPLGAYVAGSVITCQ